MQLYRACGYTFLCYPLLLEVSDFYLSQDMEFVIDEVRVSGGQTFRQTFSPVYGGLNMNTYKPSFVLNFDPN